jgi:hypothetical protein
LLPGGEKSFAGKHKIQIVVDACCMTAMPQHVFFCRHLAIAEIGKVVNREKPLVYAGFISFWNKMKFILYMCFSVLLNQMS